MFKEKIILSIIEMLYRNFLRGMIVAYVKSTHSEWDDRLVAVLDGLLGYEPKTIEDGI